mgnify:CR=1 FL=1
MGEGFSSGSRDPDLGGSSQQSSSRLLDHQVWLVAQGSSLGFDSRSLYRAQIAVILCTLIIGGIKEKEVVVYIVCVL